jgi:hypothetical protein
MESCRKRTSEHSIGAQQTAFSAFYDYKSLLLAEIAGKTFAPLVGNQAGAGMDLLLIVVGAMITLTTVSMLTSPSVRNLETVLPGYRITGTID